MSYADMDLAARLKRFVGLSAEEPVVQETDDEAVEQRRSEQIASLEASELRTALVAAGRHLLPYLRRDLDDVRARLSVASRQGSVAEMSYWSGHLERLLGTIRSMEDARDTSPDLR